MLFAETSWPDAAIWITVIIVFGAVYCFSTRKE